jgi:hypothetical protein
MKIKNLLTVFIFVGSVNALAEPTSGPLFVNLLRVYSTGDVFVSMKSNAFCSTDTFHIPATVVGRRELLATLLTAQSLNSPVLLEASNATGCAGWGTKLQSIYLAAQ